MPIELKRVYAPAAATDGCRILVDRLWPRGLSREIARVDEWARELAPSTQLRQWYGHDPAKWDQFRAAYFAELDSLVEPVAALAARVGGRQVTFVYSSRSPWNNALALKEYLELNYPDLH